MNDTNAKDTLISVQFTKEELELIHIVFRELTRSSLKKWTDLIDDGKYPSAECTSHWKRTMDFDTIRHKVRVALELEPPLID